MPDSWLNESKFTNYFHKGGIVESYIDAVITTKKNSKDGIQKFFEAAEQYDLDAMREACNDLGATAVEALQSLLSDSTLRDYIDGIEVCVNENKVSIDATCGSSGLEFLIKLISVVGPSSERIDATFSHDEEPPEEGEWPIEVVYQDGKVTINGREYHKEEPEVDEPYLETEFEPIEPKLADSQLVPLRKLCNSMLLDSEINVLAYLSGFENICKVLVDLENTHGSGLEIYEENALEFSDLRESFGEDLRNSSIHSYFCEYLRGVVGKLNHEQYLGTCIKRFDEVVYFSGALIGILEESDAKEFFESSISSQEDFIAWKDYIVMLAEDQQGEGE